jgi:spermidine dehydrogenase
MHRKIDRRDFLSGASIALTGAIVCPSLRSAYAQQSTATLQSEPGYYPPAQRGMRGSHAGSFETGHASRDGESFNLNGSYTGEEFDLVVVGGGISGLSAAWFYRQSAGPDAKVLILDNHDDFGGHAKRNEYQLDGRTILVNGGTLNLEQSSNYSTVARSMLHEIGIDFEAYRDRTQHLVDYHRSIGLDGGTFFDRETFGGEGLVTKPSYMNWSDFFDRTPLPVKAKAELKRLHSEQVTAPRLVGLSDDEKKERLIGMTYNDYLISELGLDPVVLPFFQATTHFRFYMGPEQVSAYVCWQMEGYPGFAHLNLRPTGNISPLHHIGGSHHGREPEYRENSIYFPDGNATVARMLVRRMVPHAIPGETLDDLFTAKVDYAALDRPGNSTRVRLNSTAVRVAHNGDVESARDEDVSYVQGGATRTVKARNVIFGCWHNVIPYICDDFSDEQKEAQLYGIKAPRVYTNVLLRNGRAFQKLGVNRISSPGLFHTTTQLHMPISAGSYRAPTTLDEPVIVKMHRAPNAPGQPRREQLRLGRYDLLNTSFETFERNIREQLNRMLGEGGFDAAEDIAAITVNRWPHGNAYAYDPITEPRHWAFYATDDRPCVIARQQLGRISIANSDAGASPFTDVAIDQGHRAAREALADRFLMDS